MPYLSRFLLLIYFYFYLKKNLLLLIYSLKTKQIYFFMKFENSLNY